MKRVLIIFEANTSESHPIWTGTEDKMVDTIKQYLKDHEEIKNGWFSVYEVGKDGHISLDSSMVMLSEELLNKVRCTSESSAS